MPNPPLPAALRSLLDAELAAGNEIVEQFSSFPAPPIGRCIMLKRAITTPLPAGVTYRERQSSTHSGEFTDADRRFFLLNPPVAPAPEPDMDAIRAARHSQPALPRQPLADPLVDRFEQSLEMTVDKWRDGEGYDLAAIRAASPAARERIENLLLPRPVTWREVEALNELATPKAIERIHHTLGKGDLEQRIGVLVHAPDITTDEDRIRILTEALLSSDIYGGLTQALLLIETFHPPEIINALFHAASHRNGQVAMHCAAMLMFVHGKADSAFDWSLRPFFLQFGEASKRTKAFAELCRRLGVDPARWRSAVYNSEL